MFDSIVDVVVDCEFVYVIIVCLCGLIKFVMLFEVVMVDVVCWIVLG